jgi:dihydrodipicolinate reductase
MTAPLTVGVLGARGWMGCVISDAINAAPDLFLVAGVGSGDSRDILASPPLSR